MNIQNIQTIKDEAYSNWKKINKKTDLKLKDWVFGCSHTKEKSWINLMIPEFNKVDEQVSLDVFLKEAGVIYLKETAHPSATKHGYFEALAADKHNSYMLLWKKIEDDFSINSLSKFEVELI